MVKLHYFAGRGRAETTRWMMAACQIEFKNAALRTPNDLAALRATGKLPFDQLPLLEIDGHCISQSTALIRYLARRHNLYGDNHDDAMWCDMVAGTVADFAEPAMQAAFQPSHEVAWAAMQARLDKFGPRFEARLQQVGSGFAVGSRLSFADVVLGSALTDYQEQAPDCLETYPLLAKFQTRITTLPGVARYLDSPERYPTPGDDYVISAARVLRRALPAHMPEPGRFVIS